MNDLAKCRVTPEQTLRDALGALDASGLEIVLAVDGAGKLIGTLTDGDIRRALLAGRALDESLGRFVNRAFGSVVEGTSRASVLDLMQARRINAVPILDSEGRLVGLHTLLDILGHTERPNWAVIMAGGRGERLRPLTDTIPKPMIRVAGRPILERIVLHLVGHGIRQIFVSVNYLAHLIEEHFGNGSALGCRIDYLREDRPLGTGGSLSLLPEAPAAPLLVINGDLVTQANIGQMLEFHAGHGYKITVGTHEYLHSVPFGVVEAEGTKVVGLREKPTQVWLTNAGLYVLDPALVARVPKDTSFAMPNLVEQCLDLGEPVGAFRVDEDWIDVGRRPDLQRANGKLSES
jgi:dTDP-glucose pyrophosphorylase